MIAVDAERRVAAALDAIRGGGMVVLVDDAERENEGDLVCAAAHVDATKINFMAKEGRGLICLSLPPAVIARLGLQPMPRGNCGANPRGTAFTTSIDACHGITTGISAHDRAHTIAVACHDDSCAADLVAPGHIFPLCAAAGGVLERRGHTEGASDLVQLAGLAPGAVICEIMNDDGTMARLAQLEVFVRQHHLPLLHIDDIAHVRQNNSIPDYLPSSEHLHAYPDCYQQI